jgi:hypothetical protein
MQKVFQRCGIFARKVWSFLTEVWTQAWLVLEGLQVLRDDLAQMRARRREQWA